MSLKQKSGYKLTEVGFIPEDWEVRCLGELAIVRDGTHQTPKYQSSGVPFYSVEHVTSGDFSNTKFISELEHQFLTRSFKIERGDILMTRIGSIGECKLIDWDVRASFYVSLALLKVKGASAAYIAQYSQFSAFKKEIELHSLQHATPKKINLGPISHIKVSLPPKITEQQAIVDVLSDVDALLVTLDKLVVKKRDILKSSMQQLLTGQRRMPGFCGEWKVKRLGDHLNFLNNGTNSRAELSTNGEVRYLHYGDIHGSQHLLLNPKKTSMPSLPHEKAKRLDRLENGDLVFADASEDLDGIGKAVEIQCLEDVELVAGLHTIALRFDQKVMVDGFKAYLQFIPTFRAHLRQLAAGTKVYATNRAHIASAKIKIPEIEEQAAISALLFDMDTELTALEARREKIHQLKQGMMQVLLTGNIRVS